MRIAAGKIEAAVGAFDTHALSCFQASGKAAGVVAEGLDREADHPIALVGTGDGEGVRPLFVVEGDKGELAGAVTVPAAIEAAAYGGDVRRRLLDREDLAGRD
jgi:hypothetical protein